MGRGELSDVSLQLARVLDQILVGETEMVDVKLQLNDQERRSISE